ncbi:EndoU domain-containing protein [Candidatus Dependentiae bacterium]|nr:EndoU domain-containing protein [Candidatus Dependentiae bacterium]
MKNVILNFKLIYLFILFSFFNLNANSYFFASNSPEIPLGLQNLKNKYQDSFTYYATNGSQYAGIRLNHKKDHETKYIKEKSVKKKKKHHKHKHKVAKSSVSHRQKKNRGHTNNQSQKPKESHVVLFDEYGVSKKINYDQSIWQNIITSNNWQQQENLEAKKIINDGISRLNSPNREQIRSLLFYSNEVARKTEAETKHNFLKISQFQLCHISEYENNFSFSSEQKEIRKQFYYNLNNVAQINLANKDNQDELSAPTETIVNLTSCGIDYIDQNNLKQANCVLKICKNITDFLLGGIKGATVNTVTGIAHMFGHPIETVQGLTYLAKKITKCVLNEMILSELKSLDFTSGFFKEYFQEYLNKEDTVLNWIMQLSQHVPQMSSFEMGEFLGEFIGPVAIGKLHKIGQLGKISKAVMPLMSKVGDTLKSNSFVNKLKSFDLLFKEKIAILGEEISLEIANYGKASKFCKSESYPILKAAEEQIQKLYQEVLNTEPGKISENTRLFIDEFVNEQLSIHIEKGPKILESYLRQETNSSPIFFLEVENVKHLLSPDIRIKKNGNFNWAGLHLDYNLRLEKSNLIKVTNKVLEESGIYEAYVEIGGKLKRKTFFPWYWSPEETIKQIAESLKNIIKYDIEDSRFVIQGLIDVDGKKIIIQTITETNGKIVTSYPIIEKNLK